MKKKKALTVGFPAFLIIFFILVPSGRPESACTTISPTSVTVSSTGGNGAVSVDGENVWVYNDDWITHVGTNGLFMGGCFNSYNLVYNVSANTGAARSGTITIGGEIFTVYQAAASLDISIQASPTVIPPIGSSALLITVTGPNNQPVEGASIIMTLYNAIGGGEYIMPALIYSDASGQAITTFYAGSLVSTPAGVECRATLLGDDPKSDSAYVVISNDANSAPTADAGPDQTQAEGVTVTLDGSNSSDPDDGIANYLWQQTGGPNVALSNTTAVQPTFTTPNVGPGGVALTFELTVTDAGGLTNSDTCTVNVSWNNIPPTADAGPDQTTGEGQAVTLDGSNSSDPDDGIAGYLWQQTGGPNVTLSSPTAVRPTFTTPDVNTGGASLTFELTVRDNAGLTDSDTCTVNVSWNNIPPTADAGSNQTVDEGETVTLDGSNSSDPDDGIANYLWQQTGGPNVTLSNATAVLPTFTTPNVDPDGVALTFELTVTDAGGLTDSDTCTVNVSWNNIPPTAEAGPDQTAGEGQAVTLDGSNSSDPDDGIAGYLWQQTTGPNVTLSSATAVQPTFTSPDVDEDGAILTFELRVTDFGGLTDTNQCTVIIENDDNSSGGSCFINCIGF